MQADADAMNVFEELSAWYAEPTHSWTRFRYFKKDRHNGSERACLVGGLSLVKCGRPYILPARKLKHEREVLLQAILEITGRKVRSITRYNDSYALYGEIQRVLHRAAQIWDERYPDDQKPEQLLHTAPFTVDFSEIIASTSQKEHHGTHV